LAITFEPVMLETQSKTQMTLIIAEFPIKAGAKYFRLAVGLRAR